MELISIGFKEGYDKVKEFLERGLKLLKEEGFYIDMESYSIGDIFFVKYKIDDKNYKKYYEIKEIFINRMSSLITDVILNIYQEGIINKLIDENYYYFNVNDKNRIKKRTVEFLESYNEHIIKDGMVFKVSRKARLIKIINEFLESNSEIVIDGFINFRLRYFIDIIEETLDKAVDEIMVEKEYNEFIKILQYFVEIQEPKVNEVNLLIKSNKEYILYDENYNKINNEFLNEIANEVLENNINLDDLLISSLITIAPRKIVIHGLITQETEIIRVIKNVFVEKVTECKGCEFCSNKGENKLNREQ